MSILQTSLYIQKKEGYGQGRIWRAFRAFPGRPWRRTQDSVGHTTDDKREKKNEKKWKREKCVKKKRMEERERKMDGNKREEIKKCSKTQTETEILTC